MRSHDIEEQGLLLLCQAGLLQCLCTLCLQLSSRKLRHKVVRARLDVWCNCNVYPIKERL